MTSRRTFLGYGLFPVAGALIADSVFLEPRRFRIERVDVALRGLPREFDGFTICQITDVHHGYAVSLDYASVVLSRHGQKYAEGLVRLERRDATRVYVSRGIGVVILPVRFNCPPEVALFRLKPEAA